VPVSVVVAVLEVPNHVVAVQAFLLESVVERFDVPVIPAGDRYADAKKADAQG
jgi:hypothetical protein